MLFKSNLLAQASGSLDGTVFSHNAGGRYTRNRSIPTDPGSAFQVSVRNALSTLATQWQGLASSNRAAWETYAANVPITNRLGDPINISGIDHYIRSNSPRLNFLGGTNVISLGPTTFELPSLTTPTVNITSATVASVQGSASDSWTGDTNNAMLVFASRQQSPTINFFKGPYRFAGLVRGTAAANITLPFSVASGNKVFFQFRVTTTDGRLSTPVRASDTF